MFLTSYWRRKSSGSTERGKYPLSEGFEFTGAAEREKLRYKLALEGITLVMQSESYSSQCSPLSPEVSVKYAEKAKRVKRGLFVDGERSWNADAVGAYNILRLYGRETGIEISMAELTTPYVVKVAV